jgi:hypothetical protein
MLIRGLLYRKENRVVLKNTAVYVTSFGYLGGKVVVVYTQYLEVVKRKRLYDEGGKDEVQSFWFFATFS